MSHIPEMLQRVAAQLHAKVACQDIAEKVQPLDLPGPHPHFGEAVDQVAVAALQSWCSDHEFDPDAGQPRRCADNSAYYCGRIRSDLIRFLNHRPEPHAGLLQFMDEEAFIATPHAWMPPAYCQWNEHFDARLLSLFDEAVEPGRVMGLIIQYTYPEHVTQMHAFLELVAEKVPRMPWQEFLYMDLSKARVVEVLKNARPKDYEFLITPAFITHADIMVAAAKKFRIDFQSPETVNHAAYVMKTFIPHILKESMQGTLNWGDKEMLQVLEAYGVFEVDGDRWRLAAGVPAELLAEKTKEKLSVYMPETADVFGVRYYVPAVQKCRLYSGHLHIADLLYSGPDENLYRDPPQAPGYRVRQMEELLQKDEQREWLYAVHPKAVQLPADWVMRMFATPEALEADARGY